eukprot:gene7507-15361_t
MFQKKSTLLILSVLLYWGIHCNGFLPIMNLNLKHWATQNLIYDSAFSGEGPSKKNNCLGDFLVDCQSLGAVRFVVVGPGAILETVGSFDNLRFSESPKGKLATLSTDLPCFECHIRVNEVKEVRHISIKKFERDLKIIRFIGMDDSSLLSAILHDVNDSKIASWDTLRTKYGDVFTPSTETTRYGDMFRITTRMFKIFYSCFHRNINSKQDILLVIVKLVQHSLNVPMPMMVYTLLPRLYFSYYFPLIRWKNSTKQSSSAGVQGVESFFSYSCLCSIVGAVVHSINTRLGLIIPLQESYLLVTHKIAKCLRELCHHDDLSLLLKY